MNRDIKFRAWDGVQISYDNFAISAKGKLHWTSVRTIGETVFNPPLRYDGIPEENGFILMQYTDRKDKNGTEIYENDILRDVEGLDWLIRWQSGNGMYGGWVLDDMGRTPEYSEIEYKNPNLDSVEVVGNIYEQSKK